jgi:hypothetical protein
MTAGSAASRGIRNHNPLNIRLEPKNRWQGRVDPARNTDKEFEQFLDPVWGIRAGAVLAIAHYDRRHADTIRKLAQIWAPANENDTQGYVRFVTRDSGFGPDEPLDFHRAQHLKPVLAAMIRMENGCQPYTDAQIDAGLTRAGVLPPERSLRQSRTVKGGQVAAGATALGMAAEAVRQAEPAFPLVQTALEYAPWVVAALVLAGIGVMLWARIDDRRRGLL